MTVRGWVLAAAMGWGATMCAQQPAEVKALHPVTPMPAYEVATIKPAERVTPLGMTVRRYIQQAFALPRAKGTVVGGPEWVDKNQYSIVGKPSAADEAAMQGMTNKEREQKKQLMAQSLLAERFHLKMHFETREMAVYEMVVDKGGVKMTRNTTAGEGNGYLSMEGSQKGVFVTATDTSLDVLAQVLQNFGVDRPVVNATGLAGEQFDFKMQFASDGRQFGGVVGPSDADNGSPSLFTALRELGLRLEPAKAGVEVVVIDHIEEPTEN